MTVPNLIYSTRLFLNALTRASVSIPCLIIWTFLNRAITCACLIIPDGPCWTRSWQTLAPTFLMVPDIVWRTLLLFRTDTLTIMELLPCWTDPITHTSTLILVPLPRPGTLLLGQALTPTFLMIPNLIWGANLWLTNTRTILFIEIIIRRANSLAATATKILVENPGPSTIKLQALTPTKFFVEVEPWRTIYRTKTHTVCCVQDVTRWASLYSTNAITILLAPFPWPNTMFPLAHALALVLVPGLTVHAHAVVYALTLTVFIEDITIIALSVGAPTTTMWVAVPDGSRFLTITILDTFTFTSFEVEVCSWSTIICTVLILSELIDETCWTSIVVVGYDDF